MAARPPPLDRRILAVIGAIAAVALLIRVAYVWTQADDVLFDHPPLDEARYVETARDIAAGSFAADEPWWKPPGIHYAYALIFTAAGPGLWAPRIVQAVVSAACCLLIFFIGRRVFGDRVALVAAGITAVHGVLIFEAHQLLPATWILFFDLVAVLLAMVARERRRWYWAMAAGAAVGVAAVFSPLILPFGVMAAVLLRRPLLVAASLAATILCIAPVTIQNWRSSGELVPVSTNGGINFYIGNNPDYYATVALRPGRHWKELTAQPRREGVTTPGAQSTYFWLEGLRYYGQHPVEAVGRYARKLYLFFNGREIPRDADVYAAREHSAILTVLVVPGPLPLPNGLLLPLAMIGAGLAVHRRRRVLIAGGFLVAHALLVAAFFVTERFRVPVIPVFALFAAYGGAGLVELARARRHRALLAVAGAGIALVALLNLPTREHDTSYAAEIDLYRGLVHLRERRAPDRALPHLRAAVDAAPADARMWFELGNALDAAGDPRAAADAWRTAAALDPWDSRAARSAAKALAAVGDSAGAIETLRTHIDAAKRESAHYVSDHLNLVFLYVTNDDYRRAAASLATAARLDPQQFRERAPSLVQALLADETIDEPNFWRAVGDTCERAGLTAVAEAARRRGHLAPAVGNEP